MNAVKSCLAVLAAAVALSSCSADPTSGIAGTNPKIQATPGTVVVTAGTSDSTAAVIVSAQDALGGAIDASFTISNVTGGVFTATVDTSYLPVYAGARPRATSRLVINGQIPGEGSFQVNGPGGPLTIPVRVNPNPKSIAVVWNSHTPAIGVWDTVSLPVGLRFTDSAAVSFDDNGAFATVVEGMSADSTKLYFFPGFNAHGHVKLSGMALVSTPTLRFSSVSSDTLAVGAAVMAPSTTSLVTGQPLTVVLSGPFRFTSASRPKTNANDSTSIIISVSSDSLTMVYIPIGNTFTDTAQRSVTNILYTPIPNFLVSLPTSAKIALPKLADLGGDDPAGVVPTFNLPALGTYGFFDIGSFNTVDQSPDGDPAQNVKSQVYRLNLGVPAHIVSNVFYSFGADIDIMLLSDGVTTNTAAHGGFAGAAALDPEVLDSGLLPVGTYMLDLIDYGPLFSPAVPSVGATITVTLTVQ